MSHYQTEMLLAAPAAQVYQALTTAAGLQAWWTHDCDIGSSVGARSTFYFGETYKTMRIDTLVPDAEVHWTCTDSHIAVPTLKRKDEWIGTRILFHLTPHADGTRLHFEHHGLTPQIECYELCSNGWQQFLDSLKHYVETGTGQPYREA